MKILTVGDVFGKTGTDFAASVLRKVKLTENADIVIVNAENAAFKNGLDSKSATALLDAGADVLTGGNHSLQNHEVFSLYDESDVVLRPHNLPSVSPGKGYCIIPYKNGLRLMVINLLGQLMSDPADSPFATAERLLAENKGKYDICVCDFHAEATSEKKAFGYCFDGRIQAVYGTHTHVQTADEQLLPKGSGFITDLGMTGVWESVIGTAIEPSVNMFTTRVRDKYSPAEGASVLCGAVFTINEQNLCCTEVKRIKYPA